MSWYRGQVYIDGNKVRTVGGTKSDVTMCLEDWYDFDKFFQHMGNPTTDITASQGCYIMQYWRSHKRPSRIDVRIRRYKKYRKNGYRRVDEERIIQLYINEYTSEIVFILHVQGESQMRIRIYNTDRDMWDTSNERMNTIVDIIGGSLA